MSDDDDYMSADFLEKCLPKDVAPGLLNKGQKREHNQVFDSLILD